MVESLTADEQKAAARTSYAYWYLEREGKRNGQQGGSSSSCNTSINDDDNDEFDFDVATRMKMAMKEARRHLRAENNDFDTALHRLQETCQYRMVSFICFSYAWK